ncbi:MAG: DUF4287 domain-containing protein [Caulobacteraceae bacterium]
MAEHLTERQKAWMASIREGLERDTGKSLDAWVEIALRCPETKPKARQKWLKDNYGLLQNRAMFVLSEAFPATESGWNRVTDLKGELWADGTNTAIFDAVEKAVAPAPGLVVGQRKTYSAWSREFQFAALRPLKGGKAMLGLCVPVEADVRLAPRGRESWSERLYSKLELASPADVDATVKALIKAAWERS